MPTRTAVPALGAEGWFTTGDAPALAGQRCTTCGTYVFPATAFACPNPHCAGDGFEQVELSRRGTIWSYTDARYQPPPPYVVPGTPGADGDGAEHEPFCIAAVHLAAEDLVVMGQVVPGVTVGDLTVGDEVDLVVDTLFSDDEHDYLVWKWQPVRSEA